MGKPFIRLLALAAVVLSAACTVHQTEPPVLSGPSELAQSITITAIPDSILQDGASQSSIQVVVRDSAGRPVVGQSLRLDMAVGGVVQDFGTLSARTIVTGSDGKANAVFTAPPAPPPAAGGAGTRVSIIVSPIGSNGQVSIPPAGPASIARTVDIRLVPPGVILPPADTPTAAFTVSPTPVVVNVPATFDASTSCGGAISGGRCTSVSRIASFSWNFGDGSTGTAATVSHAFSSSSTFSVTLTVTNDRGVSASTTQTVTPQSAATAGLIASFSASPTTVFAGQPVTFDANASKAPANGRITDFAWDFGDGTPVVHTSLPVTLHTFFTASNASFSVILTVTDNFGNTAVSASVGITVTGVGQLPGPAFTMSPQPGSVNQPVTFDASQSTVGAGSNSIVNYQWDFGDGSGVLGTGVGGQVVTHTYARAGTYTVKLTVTTDTGKSASVTHTLLIQ